MTAVSAQVQIDWQHWIDQVCQSVGIDPALVDLVRIHGLTRSVADEFSRPMAPVSAYLWAWAGLETLSDQVILGVAAAHADRAAALRAADPEDRDGDRGVWGPFVVACCEALALDPALADVDGVLEATRQTSRLGAKPMAPVTATLLGLLQRQASGETPDERRAGLMAAVTAAVRPQGQGR